MSTDRKDLNGKHNPLLMPIEADKAFSEVSDYGNQKYGNRYTWQENKPQDGVDKYVAAAVRHGKAYAQTGELDAESGLAHIKQLLWNAAAACWHWERLQEERYAIQGKMKQIASQRQMEQMSTEQQQMYNKLQNYQPGQIVPGTSF